MRGSKNGKTGLVLSTPVTILAKSETDAEVARKVSSVQKQKKRILPIM